MIIREIYLKRIRPFYESEMIKVITGIRRCGKSTILKQISDEIRESGVSEDHIIFINFEDFRFNRINTAEALYEYIEPMINEEQKYYLFFDEIQNVKDFELAINSFRSVHDTSIFITGSNSKLLSGELATHMSGRTLSFRIMPFNFSEYCEFRKSENDTRTNEEYMNDYLVWGGFPLVCREKEETNKAVIMSNIFDSVVLKDIIIKNNTSSPAVLEKILEYLIANSSLTVSGNNISSELSKSGISVSAPKVYDYMRYITDACVCDKVSRYDIRGRKVLSFEEKIYVCDTGFFHLKKNRVKDEYNCIIETICYNELVSRGYQVYIGKTFKGEIDFIAVKDRKKIYIQAAYLIPDETVAEREFGAYRGIDDNYPKYVVSMDKILTPRDGIKHINLIDFCLNEL